MDRQVNTAFLLGLNWEHARRWQQLKDRETELKSLEKTLKTGVAAEILGTRGHLEGARVRLLRAIAKDQDALQSFQVHHMYRDIEEESTRLTFEIKDLRNRNVVDNGMLELFLESIAQEQPAEALRIEELYKEAGVVLPDSVVKRLEDVKEFHEQVLQNRRAFLESEVARLNAAVSQRNVTIGSLDDRRAEYMSTLQNFGALDDYNRLQQLLSEKQSELEDIDRRIALSSQLEHEESAVRIEKERLRIDARADLSEQRQTWENEIALYNANSEALYETPGELVIDLRDTGFRFDVIIERSGSQGIDHMKVFCYDLMLAQLWSHREARPGFLIHDSLIFDGVDERQRARAIQLAAQESAMYGFQYICCLNSDMIPHSEFEKDFDLTQFVRLTLTDATNEGGLFGMRF